jgi:hydrogenase expression/formation protein HypC
MCLAVPGKILDVFGADLTRRARVDFGGIRREVSLAALPEAKTGDHVLVHAGFALNIVDETKPNGCWTIWRAWGSWKRRHEISGRIP